MRLSVRLLSNATTTYARMAATFALGIFSTWYILGTVGIVGFGLIALASANSGLSQAVERATRLGLVRELAAAIASAEARQVQTALTSAFVLCLQALVPLALSTTAFALLAWFGVFNTPTGTPGLELALTVLILGEGAHAGLRLLTAPHLQSHFAAQLVGLDNLLILVSRVSYAASAVLVFGWLLADSPLPVQLIGFAATRPTLQLVDVLLGVWIAKRRIPGLELKRSAYDREVYRQTRATVWGSAQVFLLLNLNFQFLAILINLLFGVAYNGLWQIVVQLGGFARMFSESLLRGIAPLATHLQQEGRKTAVVDLMARTIRYQITAVLLVVIFLGLYLEPILRLWVGGRLAADAQLAAAGIPVDRAISLVAGMALILLVAQTLRAAVFGVERILYGLGHIASYAWFAKYATLITLSLAGLLMSWLDSPLYASVALLVTYAIYYPGVILRAARRQVALPLGPTLVRSLPRPLLVAALFWTVSALARPLVPDLNVVILALLLAASALLYAALAAVLVPEEDERRRLWQMLGQAARRLTG